MLSRLFLWLTRRSRHGRRILFRHLFEILARRSTAMETWTFMNYGYDERGARGASPAPLPAAVGPERHCLQLYRRVVASVDLAGRDVLEVSCGRGGGAAYVARHLGPRTITGLDISPAAIAFCRRVHRHASLRFIQGDAENIPLPDGSVDHVINVEASFCYGDFARFLSEVHRILRSGGYFHFADLRHSDEVDGLLAALAGGDLELLQSADITAQVLCALERDGDRRADGVHRLAPWFARNALADFAGAAGSRIPTLLAAGRLRYLCFLLRKPQGRRLAAMSAPCGKSVEPAASGPSPITTSAGCVSQSAQG